MSLSDYGENLAADLLYGGGQSRPATVYAALCETLPTDTDTGSTITEATYGSYARVAVTNDATEFGPASGGSLSNLNAVTFPTATSDGGTVVAVAWLDASSGGNLISYDSLDTSKTVLSGATPSFAAGTLSMEFD